MKILISGGSISDAVFLIKGSLLHAEQHTANNWYWSDTNPVGDFLSISWATATCANDVVTNHTPVPGTLSLLALGLVGFAGINRRKKE